MPIEQLIDVPMVQEAQPQSAEAVDAMLLDLMLSDPAFIEEFLFN
jgi:hypothetical protein